MASVTDERTQGQPVQPEVHRPIGAVTLRAVCRVYGGIVAVDNVDLDVVEGEFFGLLGPSGCGKSTTLRLIAGLDLPDSGEIRIGGRAMTNVAAHKRPVNTVFQQYALF